MGSDLFALATLADELNQTLSGARVDKIVQPECDELRFFVRAGGKNRCLVVSCNAGAPRVHLTESKKANPVGAPALCMLLRKHLSAARIEKVFIHNADRTLGIKFTARTEMRDNAEYYLFVEIMNRYSNVVFTDGDLIILDAVKHLPIEAGREHVVLRGIRYESVFQPKTSFLSDCFSIIDAYPGGDLHKYLLDNVSGFSGLTATELLRRAGIEDGYDPTDVDARDRLKKAIEIFRDVRKSELFAPCVYAGKEVYPFPYSVLDDNFRIFDTMSEAYDALYTVCDAEIRNKARLKTLSNAVKRLKKRVENNIAVDRERIAECAAMDEWRIKGELIVSNIYKIKKGDEVLRCVNYYDGSQTEIPLDERLTPSQNSAACFNRYNKLKRTLEFTQKKLKEDELLLSYVASIEKELETLAFDAPATAIEEELARLGAIRKKAQKGKVRKEKPEPPYAYLAEGFTVLRGKNNLQNDELTFRIASSSDVWLHLKNAHGPHTIILTEGKTPPDTVLKTAAEIAACGSDAVSDVDYTERRNVKRQPGGHPGQVIYVNFKTLRVKPDPHDELLQN